MRRVKPSRSKPASKPLQDSNRARFHCDEREAVRGRRLRKGDLPANPYELAENKA